MRSSKFQEVAAALESRIALNEWDVNHRLPSVRALAEEYNVAAATASRAFEVLRGKGIVRPDDRSRVFRVADRESHAADRWAICLRLTPGPWQRGSTMIMSSGFVDPMNTLGVHLDFEVMPTDLNLSSAQLKERIRAVKDAGLTGLFLMPSRANETLAAEDERLVQACRDLHLPVVLIDRYLRGAHRELEWDLVTPHYYDGGFQAATHLLSTGRRRLAFVQASPTSSHVDMLSGVLMAHHVGKQSKTPIVYQFNESSGARRAYHDLADRVIADKVDGVVCYQDRVVMGLAIELMQRHYRIPDDVALTGFDDQPIGSEFTIGVTTYALPSRDLAARAFQVMRMRQADPSSPPVKVLVPSRLIIRDSSIKMAN